MEINRTSKFFARNERRDCSLRNDLIIGLIFENSRPDQKLKTNFTSSSLSHSNDYQ